MVQISGSQCAFHLFVELYSHGNLNITYYEPFSHGQIVILWLSSQYYHQGVPGAAYLLGPVHIYQAVLIQQLTSNCNGNYQNNGV